MLWRGPVLGAKISLYLMPGPPIPMSDHSLIVRTTLEVGRLSPPEIFICFRIN